MDWLVALEVVLGIIIGLCLLFLVWLFVRRRWLSGRGGVFDCALRVEGKRHHWHLGMARYAGEQLHWYRVFSWDIRPRLVLDRQQTSWAGQRPPTDEETMVLFTNHQVVALAGVDRRGHPRTYELAMTPASVTGLMSWLEASPPGLGMTDLQL
ncbi:DUF2550 domain-containing protein [Aestuariimicrobium sp. Y1814]|uniref:DUF2550 domain-containing protein n=1 Tax=Aestuariimicrobium sp. Y1814 TaxID=3418742 RepID=UPI003DA6F154